MRDIKKHQIIHYYHNKSTLEFINIGVLVYSEAGLSYRLLDESLIHQINCSTFVDKKVLSGLVRYLENVLAGVTSIEGFKSKTKSLYFDNFSFSNEVEFASEHSCEIESHIMFNHYIGHKFDHSSSVSRKEKVKESAKSIISKDFDKVFMFSEDDYYDLIIQSKNSSIIYSTVIGSLISDTDLMGAFRAELNRPVNNSYYAYVNSEDDLLRHHEKSEHAAGLLHRKMGMELTNFSSDEAIGISLERMAINI